MKLTSFLILVTCLHVSANGIGQNVTLSVKNASLEKVFTEIIMQSGVTIVYNNLSIKNAKPVTIDVKNASPEDVLDLSLKGQPFYYSQEDGYIIIKPTPTPDLSQGLGESFSSRLSPPIKISGTVIGVNKQPLAGATIRVKGKNIITTTDDKGFFELTADAGSTLIISYVGFEQREYKVSNSDPLSIELMQVESLIDTAEVVSTGYQDIPKERVTGSFVQLDNKIISRNSSPKILDRILNLTNSLRIETNAGALGRRGSAITIRGFSTINADMRPLIVIDGFPYEEPQRTGQNILQNIDPNDVESITVLRDAAAASIWGARSGNGVIVINTKKGSYNSKPTISFNSSSNIVEKPDIYYQPIIKSRDIIDFEGRQFNTGKYNEYDDSYPSFNYFPLLPEGVEVRLAGRAGKLTAAQVDQKLAAMAEKDIRDDVSKYLIRNRLEQLYNINISGGNEKNAYYASVGFNKNRSEAVRTDNSRFNIRLSNKFKIHKRVEMGAFFNYAQLKDFSTPNGYDVMIPDGVNKTAPYQVLADANGNPAAFPNPTGYRSAYIDTARYPLLLDWQYRPLDELNNENTIGKNYVSRFGGNVKVDIARGVNFDMSTQYETSNTNSRGISNEQSYNARNAINRYMNVDSLGTIVYPIPKGGILRTSNVSIKSWNVRGQLNVNRSWGIHSISGLAATEFREAIANGDFNTMYGYFDGDAIIQPLIDYKSNFPVRPSGATTIPSQIGISGSTQRFISYLGNIGYVYDARYSITASARIDASNYLGAKANQRFVPLWSAGLRWNVSNEAFFNSTLFKQLIFRTTYGYNGNMSNRATALPTATKNPPEGSFTDAPYMTLNSLPNPGLTWEKLGILNFGIDFILKNQILNGSIEYYSKTSKNLIGTILTDPTVGTLQYTGNLAHMKSSGIDVQLSTTNINKAVKWNTILNFSYNTDKITKYDLNETARKSYGTPLAIGGIVVGRPLLKIYSIRYAGLDPNDGGPLAFAGDSAINYIDYDNIATPQDLQYHGTISPKVFGNMLNQFYFKGFDLSFNIVYRLNYYFRRRSINYENLFNFSNGHSDYYQRWQKPGDELKTKVPSEPEFSSPNRDNLYTLSNALVERSDNIRLTDIKFGYTFTKDLFPKLPVRSINLFVLAQNLGVIWKKTKYDVDPDVSIGFPISKGYSMGINVTF